MLQKYNRYKLLKVFLDSPNESFRLRELSRESGIAPPSVMIYLEEFEKEGLIEKYERKGIPFYRVKFDNEDFRFYMRISILFELHKSGLIDFIWDKLHPEAIILYGSCARGESIEKSDIDLFVIGKEKKLDLDEFSDKLGKEIHVMFAENLGKIHKALRNNIINGIVLKGYIEVFK